ncbi:hypothetical protein GCM10009745_41400 [Kribbella yunnanensis]|uniref:Uncharacterized protein n=1 Tax=Kribbella yunnanensis TaxID=190194 RepID=A0ABN2HQE5_9ACTN
MHRNLGAALDSASGSPTAHHDRHSHGGFARRRTPGPDPPGSLQCGVHVGPFRAAFLPSPAEWEVSGADSPSTRAAFTPTAQNLFICTR